MSVDMDELKGLIENCDHSSVFHLLLSVFDDVPAIHGYVRLDAKELLSIIDINSLYLNEITSVAFSQDTLRFYGVENDECENDQSIWRKQKSRFIDCIGIGVSNDEPLIFQLPLTSKIRVANQEDISQLYGFYICSPGDVIKHVNKKITRRGIS